MAYLDGFGAEGDYLRNRFDSQWGSTTDIAWGNMAYTPGDDPWVRFSVTHSGADRMNPGTNPIRRHDGMVQVEVFVPLNDGEDEVDDYCDRAAEIFRDHTSQQGLRFRSPYVVTVGRNGKWFKKDVLIPFVRDVIHS